MHLLFSAIKCSTIGNVSKLRTQLEPPSLSLFPKADPGSKAVASDALAWVAVAWVGLLHGLLLHGLLLHGLLCIVAVALVAALACELDPIIGTPMLPIFILLFIFILSSEPALPAYFH